MYLASETISERYLFTYPERKAALTRSGGVCACCGKKLTTKTMTVDHIIPISRGGTNEAENLVALCPECNNEKGNMLYLPRGYYLAIRNKNELYRMERYVIKWFESVREQFDIEKFPLITPESYLHLEVPSTVNRNKNLYIPQMIYKWCIIGKESYEEIEAVTDLNIREVRKMTEDFSKSIVQGEDTHKIPTVALYSLRKKMNDKIIAVMAVQYRKESNHLTIWMPWCDSPEKWKGQYVYQFINLLLYTIVEVCQYDIDSYVVICDEENIRGLDYFFKRRTVSAVMGKYFNIMDLENERGEKCGNAVIVIRKEPKMLKNNLRFVDSVNL